MVFTPSAKPILLIDHEVVPVAVPEVGEHVEHDHVTTATEALSEAVPPRLTVLVLPLS
jgi:hypothetical protein